VFHRVDRIERTETGKYQLTTTSTNPAGGTNVKMLEAQHVVLATDAVSASKIFNSSPSFQSSSISTVGTADPRG
jgi:hypothetical protein